MIEIDVDYDHTLKSETLTFFIEFLTRYPISGNSSQIVKGIYSDDLHSVKWKFNQNVLFYQVEPGKFTCYFTGGTDLNGWPTLQELGRGSYGIVYNLSQVVSVSNLIYQQYHQNLALKVQLHDLDLTIKQAPKCEIKPLRLEEAMQEFENLKHIPHLKANLFHYNDVTKLSQLIMQQIPGIELFSFLNEHEASEHLSVLARLTISHNLIKSVLEQIITPKFYHNDLKLENAKITPELEVNFCDFGLATRTNALIKNYGTVINMAPEVLQAFLSGKFYMPDEKIDVFAVGIMLWEIWGQLIYIPAEKSYKTYLNYLNTTMQTDVLARRYFLEIPWEHRPNIPLQFKISHILSAMLAIKPNERANFAWAFEQFAMLHKTYVDRLEQHAKPSLLILPEIPPRTPSASSSIRLSQGQRFFKPTMQTKSTITLPAAQLKSSTLKKPSTITGQASFFLASTSRVHGIVPSTMKTAKEVLGILKTKKPGADDKSAHKMSAV